MRSVSCCGFSPCGLLCAGGLSRNVLVIMLAPVTPIPRLVIELPTALRITILGLDLGSPTPDQTRKNIDSPAPNAQTPPELLTLMPSIVAVYSPLAANPSRLTPVTVRFLTRKLCPCEV